MFVWEGGRVKASARLKKSVMDLVCGRGQFGSLPPPA
jgi:hypothetical protein